jgi:O-antigen/teichoic acid export membrane protein
VEYEESAIVLQLLLWMLGITLLSVHYRCTLIGCGHQRLELVSTAVGAGLNVLLIVLLYPRFGLVGTASAMLISELVTGALAYSFVKRFITLIDSWQHLRWPVVVALALALSMYLTVSTPLWLRICIAVALFIAGVCLFDTKILKDLRTFMAISPVSESRATR